MRRFIYFLSMTDDGHESNPSYEVNDAMVVVARSAGRARSIAAGGVIDEDPATWLRPHLSKCRKIGEVTPGCNLKERIVAKDNNAS